MSIDERDLGTPDDWIPRDPRLIRLTGRHPFNAEPPTPELMKFGFLTPTSIHYVRNHGAVPKLRWETHKLEISGLVEGAMTLTMDEIAALPSIKIPVTLACSGNRRKEQNMVAKSLGFHWGPGAVSTSVWRGVRLADVLRKCGIKSSSDGSPARSVCFEGADRLPSDYYGTSIPIKRALDEYFDVLLAYEMNGGPLTPDHGYPLRLIVPGCIGGRAIKWLRRIVVSENESDNYYHFHDNRVLPPNIDNGVTAAALDAWKNADDIIYDFNIQSVITHPGHGELVRLDNDNTYTVRGYAYTGSGLKVKRVQVSLDGGKSWCTAQLDHQEEKMSVGDGSRYWCWRLWELDIQMSDLTHCGDLTCRAWDANNNTQPQTTEWNLMGMMHNAWYVVKAHIERTPVLAEDISSRHGTTQHIVVSIRFEHPTVIGEVNGEGWMKPPSRDLKEVTTLGDKVLEEPDPYRFTKEEVAKHTGSSDAWVIVHNKVYDCSAFLEEHPGGPASILSAAGTDVTKVFKEIHSIMSHEIFGNYLLGEVDENCKGLDSTQQLSDGCGRNFLTPQWQPIRLVKKEITSHDTRIFRFTLSDPSIKFSLPTGKHVFLRGKANDGKVYVRAYTPISDDSLVGHADFLVKIYKPNKKFPEGGHLSQVLDALHIGDTVDVRGPLGSFLYSGHGRWTFGTHSGRALRIITMAGGTGITPIYQLVRAIVNDHTDRTEVRLIYANRTVDSILLREELCQLEKQSAGRVKICFTLSDPPKDWSGCTGHIDERMVREYGTFESHETLNHAIDTIAVLCGPPGLIDKACLPNIVKIYGNEMMRMRTFHF
ncbi:hypothetical protein BG011_005507 [Mortierella polycephala]|uniref:Nitrate reductase [NADPH] n=1 Tax=Mortierella polycephala TaxID=41804 RepID=A0A9P6PVD4_9FUNG|nr:hypothetical protein BG011_005507 [Mortierella polycephala]